MPTKRLPNQANIDHLKHQARDLRKAFQAGEMSAYQRAREFHPDLGGLDDTVLEGRTFTLSDAQLTIAREYGYASWVRLRGAVAADAGADLDLTHNERIPDGPFRQALDLMDDGDVAGLRSHLAAHPGLVTERVTFEGGNYFSNPALIEFIAENPMRQHKMPKQVVGVLQTLLDAGAGADKAALTSTVELMASGFVSRESGSEDEMLRLLVQHGADPNGGVVAAMVHGEFASVRTLIDLGAPVTLPVMAGMGDLPETRARLAGASIEDKQLALSWAALFNHGAVVTALIAAGADPDRYNPPGGHSHCTPMHSAACEGHLDAVRALVEAGARTDILDIHHNSTPQFWAEYMGHPKVAEYLAGQGR